MRISDWSSDVCSSDLVQIGCEFGHIADQRQVLLRPLFTLVSGHESFVAVRANVLRLRVFLRRGYGGVFRGSDTIDVGATLLQTREFRLTTGDFPVTPFGIFADAVTATALDLEKRPYIG